MEKKPKYIKNLDEKIYFICFVKPSFKSEIAELLYGEKPGKKNTAYATLVGKESGKLEDLASKKWLNQVELKDVYRPNWWKEERTDGRAWRRLYYTARPDPLIAKIKDKVKLTDFDVYVLRNIFNSRVFRESVCDSNQILKFLLEDDLIAPIDYILTRFEYFAITHLKNKYLSFIGRHIKNQGIYDFFTKGIKEAINKQDIGRFKEKIKKYFPSGYEEMLQIRTTKELSKKLGGVEYLMFVPSSLLEKIKGISVLGLFELIFQSINSEVKDMENNIKMLWPNVSSKIDTMAQ